MLSTGTIASLKHGIRASDKVALWSLMRQ